MFKTLRNSAFRLFEIITFSLTQGGVLNDITLDITWIDSGMLFSSQLVRLCDHLPAPVFNVKNVSLIEQLEHTQDLWSVRRFVPQHLEYSLQMRASPCSVGPMTHLSHAHVCNQHCQHGGIPEGHDWPCRFWHIHWAWGMEMSKQPEQHDEWKRLLASKLLMLHGYTPCKHKYTHWRHTMHKPHVTVRAVIVMAKSPVWWGCWPGGTDSCTGQF